MSQPAHALLTPIADVSIDKALQGGWQLDRLDVTAALQLTCDIPQ